MKDKNAKSSANIILRDVGSENL